MTSEVPPKYPWQLYLLSAFLVLLALRDYFSKYALYSQFSSAGIRHNEMWDFSLHPVEASIYLMQHVLGFAAIATVLALWIRSRFFPAVFLGYYVLYIGIAATTAALIPRANVVGGILFQSLVCVPWLIYVMRSTRVRVALNVRTAQQAVQPDRA